MILPGKHLKVSSSILNLGALLLQNITGTQTVTLLWEKSKFNSEIKSYESFTLGLDLLFILGVIVYKDGIISKVSK